MKNRNTIIICTTILLVFSCFGLLPKRRQSFQRRTGATLDTTRQRGKTLFLASPLAQTIRHSVGFHLRPLPLATTTRPLGPGRSLLIRRTLIRPPAPRRFGATLVAPLTRPMASQRFLATPAATPTRPSVLERSRTTTALPTQLSGLARSETAPPAPSTWRWVMVPASTSLRPITLLLSAPVAKTRPTVATSATFLA